MKKILSALLVAVMLVCMLPAFVVSGTEIYSDIIEVPIATDDRGNVLTGTSCTGWNKEWVATEDEFYLAEGEDWDQFLFDYEFSGGGRMELDFKAAQTYESWDFGVLFCVTDADNDRAFVDNQEDWSGYWLLTNHLNELCIRKKGAYNGNVDSYDFHWSQYLNEKNISPYEGYHLAIEWDGKGKINVYVNDELAYFIDDSETPLTGAYCGLRGAARDKSGVSFSSIKLIPDRGDEVPVAKFNGNATTGYSACGDKPWSNTAEGLVNRESNSIFVLDESFEAGTAEVTISKGKGDNGLVFGLTGSATDFWESKVQYYFLFVNNSSGELILAKTGDGIGWCWMKSMPCPKWDTCTEIDLKLVYNGNGYIEMWANDELAYTFCDNAPLHGTRIGVRAGAADVKFTNFNVTSTEPSDEGLQGGIELPFAKVGDKTLTGYVTGGPWNGDGSKVNVTDTALVTDSWATAFVVENDSLPLLYGSLTANVRAGSTTKADNWMTGILFGIEAEKNVSMWKNSAYSPKAYVLYVDQNGKLNLAKTGMYAEDDKLMELKASADAIADYVVNEKTVEIKAEFVTNDDWSLTIKGYANGELLLEYNDTDPLLGERYGFAARCAGSELLSLVPVDNSGMDLMPPMPGDDETDDPDDNNSAPDVNNDATEDPADDSSIVLYIVIAAGAAVVVAVVVVIIVKKKKA